MKPEKLHRLLINYPVELTPKYRLSLLKCASALGLDYDKPKPQVLLKRLFRDHGMGAFAIAEDYEKEEAASRSWKEAKQKALSQTV